LLSIKITSFFGQKMTRYREQANTFLKGQTRLQGKIASLHLQGESHGMQQKLSEYKKEMT